MSGQQAESIDKEFEQDAAALAQQPPQHQTVSQPAETPVEAAPASKSDAISESAKKVFAHDINAKISTLEEEIHHLGDSLVQVDERLKPLLGDLKSRTVAVSEELNALTSRVGEVYTQLDVQSDDINLRLRQTVAAFNHKLGNVDERLVSHHADIDLLKSELDAASDSLLNKLETLQTQTRQKLDSLSQTQQAQACTQQLLSDQLDTVQSHTHTNADTIHALQTEVSLFERLTGERFRKGAITGGLALCLLVACIAYFHFWAAPDYSTAINSKVDDLRGEMAQRYLTQAEFASLESVLERKVEGVSQAINGVVIANQQELSNMNEQLAAIELSVYGSDDPVPTPLLTLQGEDWLSSRNAGHYAIQLVGVYREAGMHHFINQHADALNEHTLSYSVGTYRGQPWYNLYYGDFSSFAEAQKALDALPDKLESNAPWVRQFASIQ
ncbi:MAG: SPOR domain-containing protein [Oleiphilaceae bacterium]|nr:SPOR domain-containing protein [Oleiphilaceae bacterium]